MAEPFTVKKWSLFTFCVIGIILVIVLTIVVSVMIDNLDKPSDVTKEDWEAAKKVVKTTLISVCVVNILFELIGLIGAYKESYCLTLTFAILMTLITLGSIASALESPTYWASFAIDLIVTILAYSFARDLKRLRNSTTAPTQGSTA